MKRKRRSVAGKCLGDFPITLDLFDCDKNKMGKEIAARQSTQHTLHRGFESRWAEFRMHCTVDHGQRMALIHLVMLEGTLETWLFLVRRETNTRAGM